MSSRPLFVKRSRIINRVIVFGISLLILAVVVAVAVWKIKGFGDLAFIKSPFMSSEAVIAAVIPDHIQSEPESTSNIPKQTEVSAVAILVKTQPTEKANTVAHTWQNNQQKVDDKAISLRTALDLWSKAWSTQDVPTYLNMYTADFMTPQGMDREAWAQIRSERIMSKQKIHHNIRNLRIKQEGLDAVVKFTQIYADERIQIIDRKTMRWVYRDGRWLITQEATD